MDHMQDVSSPTWDLMMSVLVMTSAVVLKLLKIFVLAVQQQQAWACLQRNRWSRPAAFSLWLLVPAWSG